MKKTKKNGFTIVELVIVIAVIAILIAVLIPTFSKIIGKANESNDTQIVRQLNTAIEIESVTADEGKPVTMYDANKMVQPYGLDVEGLATKSKLSIAWDCVKQRFVLLNEKEKTFVFPVDATSSDSGLIPENERVNYFLVRNTLPDATNEYSIYAGPAFNETSVSTNVGFDAGNKQFTSVTYSSNAAQNVVIRTNTFGTKLTVNASKDNVYHYGDVGALIIQAVASTSYHENGNVKFAEIAGGNLVLEQTSKVDSLHFATTEGKFENSDNQKITVDLSKVSEENMPEFSRDPVTIAEEGTLVAKVTTSKEDYIWLTKTGIIEQITLSDSETEAKTAYAQKSDVNYDIADQIANNIERNTDGSVKDQEITVSESTYTVKFNTETREFEAFAEGSDTPATITSDIKSALDTKIEAVVAESGLEATQVAQKIEEAVCTKFLDVRDDDGDGIKETLYGFGDYWNDTVVTIPASVTKIAQSVTTTSSYNYYINYDIIGKSFTYTKRRNVFEATVTEIASYSAFYVNVNGSYDNNGSSETTSSPTTYPAACETLIFEGNLDFSSWNTNNDATFNGTNIKEIRMNNVTVIPDRLFNGASKLEKIEFNSVQSIGANAFKECKALANITLPEGLTTIGGAAFYGTAIKEIVLPSTLTSCGRSSIEITGNELFYGMSELESVTFKGTTLPSTPTHTLIASTTVTFENVPLSIFSISNTKLKEIHFENGDVATQFINRHTEGYNGDNLEGFMSLEIVQQLDHNLIIYVSEYSSSTEAFWGQGYDFREGRTLPTYSSSNDDKRSFYITSTTEKYELDTEYKVKCSGPQATNTIIFKLEPAK